MGQSSGGVRSAATPSEIAPPTLKRETVELLRKKKELYLSMTPSAHALERHKSTSCDAGTSTNRCKAS